MQTLKSCEIQDLYKHLCYKDLQDYIRKDGLYDTLKGLCDTELDKIKNVLGITSVYVEKVLREYSPNAIANGTVTAALREKADKKDLHSVAFSGDYRELINKPCELPNPEELVIDLTGDGTGNVLYKGDRGVRINLFEWLDNYLVEHINDYVTPTECDCPIKGIKVNNVEQPIDDCGIVNITINSPNMSNYYNKAEVDTFITTLNGEITSLKARVTQLEQQINGGGGNVNP